jgi:SAM-dependent methyltransferase
LFGLALENDMRIGELILSTLSSAPSSDASAHADPVYLPGEELAVLRHEFPDLSTLVAGKRVADFGCGTGEQAIALARDEGCDVVGIDSNPATLARANARAAAQPVKGRVRFVEGVTPDIEGTFDVVISQNAMEHFPDPDQVVSLMTRLVRPGGVLLVTFGPPWYAPFGSHMHYFCKVPWLNLLFSERTVMNVRSRYRNDGARRYVDVESGLNQMSLAKFERVVARAGVQVRHRHYGCVKGLDFLGKLPVVRELFVNQVSCVLETTCVPVPQYRSTRLAS